MDAKIIYPFRLAEKKKKIGCCFFIKSKYGYKSEQITNKLQCFNHIKDLLIDRYIDEENALILIDQLLLLKMPVSRTSRFLKYPLINSEFVEKVQFFRDSLIVKMFFETFPENPIFVMHGSGLFGNFYYNRGGEYHVSENIASKQADDLWIDQIKSINYFDSVELARLQYYYDQCRPQLPKFMNIRIILSDLMRN